MTIYDLKDLMVRKCTNLYRSATVIQGETTPVRYERADLNKLSEEAYARGEDVFYAVPINPDNPDSTMIKSDPIYEYNLLRSLTEDEYTSIFGEN